MRFVALLRGVNVGGNRKVEMKRLRSLLESLGYTNVSTYLNSGNAIFESDDGKDSISNLLHDKLEAEFGFEIPLLIKTVEEMKTIASAIPDNWKNDSTQRTDVAYLFSEIDISSSIDDLPIKRDYLDIRYISGA
ncbi:MAG: DUF1697 domain-containing protein, partial [Spirochaetales bacterium]|nr:DUF1697 domain-containing protein [Spirochaetales bacterium]